VLLYIQREREREFSGWVLFRTVY